MSPDHVERASSCETTLIRLTEDWKMAADNKEYVTVLSTDMSKAFDAASRTNDSETLMKHH